METFEIRILRSDGKPGIITQQRYLNADAAIAAAKLLASGRRFEVWNGDYCVYAPARWSDFQRPPEYPAA